MVRLGAEFNPVGVPALTAEVTCAALPVKVGTATEPLGVKLFIVSVGVEFDPVGVPAMSELVATDEPVNVGAVLVPVGVIESAPPPVPASP